MRDATTVILEWLDSIDGLVEHVGERIGTHYDQAAGLPAVIVGSVTGGPDSDGETGVAPEGTYTVTLGVVGGRHGDTPDFSKAAPAASSVEQAVRALPRARWEGSGGEAIPYGEVNLSDRQTSPDGNAVAFLTLELQVVGR